MTGSLNLIKVIERDVKGFKVKVKVEVEDFDQDQN